MTTRAIVSVAVGERYEPYGRRLLRTLSGIGGYKGDFEMWSGEWPPGSPPHQESHYAFKWHAVRTAVRNGADIVIWLDSACYAVADIEWVWREVERRSVYVVAAFEFHEKLGEWISDPALAYFGVHRDYAMTLRLSGGCVVGLDMGSDEGKYFYEQWGELATKTDIFMTAHSRNSPDRMRSLWIEDGSDIGCAPGKVLGTDPRMKGHRSDEACFSLMLDEMEIQQADIRYFNRRIKSGYDL